MSSYHVAYNEKEELFAVIEDGMVHLYFLVKILAQGMDRARIRRRDSHRLPQNQSTIHSLSLISHGAAPCVALGLSRSLAFYVVNSVRSEDSLRLHFEHDICDYGEWDNTSMNTEITQQAMTYSRHSADHYVHLGITQVCCVCRDPG
jgi:hypothetical protein